MHSTHLIHKSFRYFLGINLDIFIRFNEGGEEVTIYLIFSSNKQESALNTDAHKTSADYYTKFS